MDFARVSRIRGVGVANAPRNAWFGAGVATVSRIRGVGVANAPQNAWFGAGFVEIICVFFRSAAVVITKITQTCGNTTKINSLCVIT